MDFTGQTIGQYQIEEKLDKDNPGMSEVYRGYNPVLDRQVVIKILASSLARDPSFVQRFQQEARALARLKHPNIVSVYDAGHYAQFDYLVMEYIPGGSLAGLINREAPLPLSRVVTIIREIASALDFAHSPPRSMVHRDIKPANILLDADGTAKLTDFGLVKVAEVSLTVVGQRFGTPAYMSPEQVLPVSGVGPWTDIYALGIVAYQMLTKKLPFRGNVQQILDAQLKQPAPSMRSFEASIPHAVDEVVLRALNKAPNDRYPSAGAFAAALEAAARSRAVAAQDATLLPTENPYATRLVEAVRRPEPLENGAAIAEPATPPPITPPPVTPPPVTPSVQPRWNAQADAPTEMQPAVNTAWSSEVAPVKPLPPIGQPGVTPEPAQPEEERSRSKLLPIIVGVVAVLVVLALIALVAIFLLRGSPAATSTGRTAEASAQPAGPLAGGDVDAAQTPVASPPTAATPSAPPATPTTAPTTAPTAVPVAISAINPTSVFTATQPLAIKVSGSGLDGITKAQLVAPNRAPINLSVEQASADEMTLVIGQFPEPLNGSADYTLVLNDTPQSGSTITLQDFRERKQALGILLDYQFTGRVGQDTTSPYTQLRKQPDAASEAIGTLRNNDTVEILNEQGDWYLLRIAAASDPAQNGIVGWLERWLVNNQNVPPQPTNTPAPPTPTRVAALTFGARVDVNYEGSGNSGQFTSCVSGKVLGAGGKPISGAAINVNNGPSNSFNTRTGANGIYHVCGLGASHWSVVLQNIPGQKLARQVVGRVYVNGGSQDAIVNFSQR